MMNRGHVYAPACALALLLCFLAAPASARAMPQKEDALVGLCTRGRAAPLGTYTYLDTSSKDPLCKAAIPALKAAAALVVGQTEDAAIIFWFGRVSADPGWKAKFDGGLNFGDATAMLKGYLAGPLGADLRAKAVENAFMEVFGRESKPEEQAEWDAQIRTQKAWYATIINALRGRLKENAFAKQGAIVRAYKAVFGREPTQGDSQYWQGRDDHYRLIREANRNWLYSPQGAKDLVETVTRALRVKSGKTPSADEVKKAMTGYSQWKLTYEEMIRSPLYGPSVTGK